VRRLERLVAIGMLLSSRRRLRGEAIAEHFAVSVRTIYRDMKALQSAGFPVTGNPGDGYRLTEESFLRPLGFTASEAEALTVAAHLLAGSGDPALRETLGRATAKLEAALDRATKRRVRELAGQLAVPAIHRTPPGPMAGVLEALRTHAVVRIDYVDLKQRRSTREIEPLGLLHLGGAWLVIAYCRLRRDARAFLVERIAKWKPTAATFAPRPDMSFADVIERERKNVDRVLGS
jgi:predicted DNA-binding transcriptional regulator YafY